MMISEAHCSNVGKTLLEFKRNDFLCDTILMTNDGQLKAHGVVLAAVSPIFKRALEISQSQAGHFLNFPEIDTVLLEIFLHFAYTGKLVLPLKFSHKKELTKIFGALQTLGLDLNQLNGSEIKFTDDAEEFLNESLEVKIEEKIYEVTHDNGHIEEDQNSSTSDQLSSSVCLREIKDESALDNQLHISSTSEEYGQCLEDVTAFEAHASNDSLELNEVTNGWVLHSETGVHVVEIPACTLAEVQSGIHKQKEKSLMKVKNRRTSETRGNVNAIASQDVSSDSTDEESKVSGELPSTDDSAAEVMHEELPGSMVKKKKKKRQRLMCPTCGKTFSKIDHLTLHLRVHTGEKPYTCDVCYKMFSFVNNLHRHMRTHTGDKRYLCHLCGSAFIQKTTLEDHIAVHTKERKHPCVQCGKFFKSASCLRAHSKRHKLGSVRNRKENLSQPELLESVKHAESILTDSGFVRFVCKICNRDYASKNSLAIHVQHHSSTRPFACNLCKKSFWQRAHLEIHRRTHTGERPFTCTTCGKSFTYAGGLSTHIRLHTGEKPYKCSICDSSYTQQAHLKSHLRTHSGEKPFECKACGKKYRNKVDLRFHLKRNDACNQEVS